MLDTNTVNKRTSLPRTAAARNRYTALVDLPIGRTGTTCKQRLQCPVGGLCYHYVRRHHYDCVMWRSTAFFVRLGVFQLFHKCTEYSYGNAEEQALKLTKWDEFLWRDILTKSDENQWVIVHTIGVRHWNILQANRKTDRTMKEDISFFETVDNYFTDYLMLLFEVYLMLLRLILNDEK
jgi:hypothetical protein